MEKPNTCTLVEHCYGPMFSKEFKDKKRLVRLSASANAILETINRSKGEITCN